LIFFYLQVRSEIEIRILTHHLHEFTDAFISAHPPKQFKNE